MEKYKAVKYKELEVIQLESSEELDKLYQTIANEENFILQWDEEDILKSEVIIVTNISSKVKTGDMKLTAIQEQNGGN